jgi:hypothetical protein
MIWQAAHFVGGLFFSNYLIETPKMKRFMSVAGIFLVSLAFVGCGDSAENVPFEKSELEKYVEENPVPLVGEEDFDEADAMANE